MSRYVISRLVQAGIALFGVFTIVFLLIRVSGDPGLLMAGPDADAASIAQMRSDLGLDHPLPVQFAIYLGHVSQLDFGDSFYYRQPALDLILARVPATVQVTGLAWLLSLAIGIPIGTFAAYRRNTKRDQAARVFALAGQAMPNYWLGLMLILLLSVRFPIFPTSGTGGVMFLILPAVTLGWSGSASIIRLLRASMIEVLGEDYIRTAHAKGLPPSIVLRQHALRNAFVPILTLMGFQIANLLSGSALVETVFAVPGIGRTLVQAVFLRDYPVVQAVVILASAILIFCNLVVDLLYGVVDPRIRLSRGGDS